MRWLYAWKEIRELERAHEELGGERKGEKEEKEKLENTRAAEERGGRSDGI